MKAAKVIGIMAVVAAVVPGALSSAFGRATAATSDTQGQPSSRARLATTTSSGRAVVLASRTGCLL